MPRARLVRICLASAALALAVAAPAQAAPSCAGQFVPVAAKLARPLGLNVVVPEIREPTLGQTHLGEAVVTWFARADRTACPITPE